MEIEFLLINVKRRPIEDEPKLPRKDDTMREDEEMLKARIEAAETLYQIHNQARSKISEEIKERKIDRDKVTSELHYSLYPYWLNYGNTIEWSNKEIKRLQYALHELDGPKQVTPVHYRMKHCCNTRAKERQLVREIKEAEAAATEKLVADAAVKATMTNHLSSREDIEYRIKCVANNRYLQRQLEAIQNDIRRLQIQLAAVNQKKSHTYRSILELKRQRGPSPLMESKLKKGCQQSSISLNSSSKDQNMRTS